MLRRLLGLFRGAAPPDEPRTEFDEVKRAFTLEKVASSFAAGSPSEERSSSVLAMACTVRYASKSFRSPMWDVAKAKACGAIVRRMSPAARARANHEYIALVYFIASRIGETRGMSREVLDVAYTKFLGLLAERRLLRNDAELQALSAVVSSAFQEYRAEFSRTDGPGAHWWLDRAAARRVLGDDGLGAQLELGGLITDMAAAVGATLDGHADVAPAQ